MLKITRTHFPSYRNNEHFQFQSDFFTLINQFDTGELGITELFENDYQNAYHDEDESLKKIMKSAHTEARSEDPIGRYSKVPW